MNEADMETFRNAMAEAQSAEEREKVRAMWLPHMSRCQLSTNKRVKELQSDMAEVKSAVKQASEAIERTNDTIKSLHAVPKWKDDKVGWLKTNWMWVVLMLYVAQNMLGLDIHLLATKIFQQ